MPRFRSDSKPPNAEKHPNLTPAGRLKGAQSRAAEKKSRHRHWREMAHERVMYLCFHTSNVESIKVEHVANFIRATAYPESSLRTIKDAIRKTVEQEKAFLKGAKIFSSTTSLK
jgi:hypothetical protein